MNASGTQVVCKHLCTCACSTPNHIQRRRTKGAKSCSVKIKMPKKANEIAVEWLESNDVGKNTRNRIALASIKKYSDKL